MISNFLAIQLWLKLLFRLLCRYGPGSILVAFASGIVKLVSTLESTMGQQQAQLQLPGSCTSAAFCKATSKMAVGGISVVLLPFERHMDQRIQLSARC